MFQPSAYSYSQDYGALISSGASASDIVQAYGINRQLASKIVSVSKAVGIPDPAMLANVINFETGGTFDPRTVNAECIKHSGASECATGLIQFTKWTASELNTTTTALRRMSALDQMHYVQRYFEMARIKKFGSLRTQADVYMAIFYPDAIGKGLRWRFPPGSMGEDNPGIKTPGDYVAMANRNAKMTPTEGGWIPGLPSVTGMLVPEYIRTLGTVGLVVGTVFTGLISFAAYKGYRWYRAR